MMQWFINEVRERFSRLEKDISEKKCDCLERVAKLEGELKALKARMGKKPPE